MIENNRYSAFKFVIHDACLDKDVRVNYAESHPEYLCAWWQEQYSLNRKTKPD